MDVWILELHWKDGRVDSAIVRIREGTQSRPSEPVEARAKFRYPGKNVVGIAMGKFTELELAALNSIFSETPELAVGLHRQLEAASVTERRKTAKDFSRTLRSPMRLRDRLPESSRL